ncbi:alpha/beta hydrolase [Paraburkholderia strydomiana]|uniref:alpha/beta fold hydrolase n=1 Tax=Paraburkholderia strydomiana TaxID=1245417 RepID=UPI0038BC3F94
MSYLKISDGAEIFYKDWGEGTPVVFSHGWPLSADAWDAQMFFLGHQGCRVIAHDRRGHGRSSQTWNGNSMDTYADDLAALLDHLNLYGVNLVGHSIGGAEVARYIGRHGTSRVAKAMLIGAVPPIMLRTTANPQGLPMGVFDGIRSGLKKNRSQFYKDLAIPFFNFNRPGAEMSQGTIDSFWAQAMMGSIKGQYDCVKEFSEVDYTEDVKKIDVPLLILHGDDDQIVPIDNAARKAVTLAPNATLKVYSGASHGMTTINADQVNRDLLDFIQR